MTTATTKRRASIIHGDGATPEDHWFGRLAEQLDTDGIRTMIAALPNPQDPDPARWPADVHASLGSPDENPIVVAHGLGCLTVLRCLRSLPGPGNLAPSCWSPDSSTPWLPSRN
ncbi:alpha/beta hydrolase [Streptomyces sp. NPDC057474]|uniref:alpha/beta hydrolase n=1 Tax=Streptomyces sp. NPDC057474 TaxID=3346144 RepID=UPI0036B74198